MVDKVPFEKDPKSKKEQDTTIDASSHSALLLGNNLWGPDTMQWPAAEIEPATLHKAGDCNLPCLKKAPPSIASKSQAKMKANLYVYLKEATTTQIHEKSTKKTKNRNGQRGSHEGADARKIHEKNEKSESSKRKPLPGGALKKRNNSGQNYGLHKDRPP